VRLVEYLEFTADGLRSLLMGTWPELEPSSCTFRHSRLPKGRGYSL
jgi:hypothetical protein